MAKRPSRPRDPNQLAKLIVDLSTGEIEEPKLDEKQRATLEARRKGGIRGSKARSKALTPSQKSAIASIAAQARWKKRGN